jgi:hypothetical protein
MLSVSWVNVVGSVADILEVRAAFIFRVEVYRFFFNNSHVFIMQVAENIQHNDMAVTVTCRYTLISDNP